MRGPVLLFVVFSYTVGLGNMGIAAAVQWFGVSGWWGLLAGLASAAVLTVLWTRADRRNGGDER